MYTNFSENYTAEFGSSKSHTIRHTHSRLGLLGTSDQLVAEAATYATHNKGM